VKDSELNVKETVRDKEKLRRKCDTGKARDSRERWRWREKERERYSAAVFGVYGRGASPIRRFYLALILNALSSQCLICGCHY